METTILLFTLVGVLAFAAGWQLKQNRFEKEMQSLIAQLQSTIREHRDQVSNINTALGMNEHIEMLRKNIDVLKDKQQQVRSLVQDLEQEYLEKKRFIEQNRAEVQSDAKARLKEMKEKSKALKKPTE